MLNRVYRYISMKAYSFQYFVLLKRSQFFPPDELERIQTQKLRFLLEHAYENVPYYHKLFKERRLKPKDIKSVKKLAKLPIISKEKMKRDPSEFIARNWQNYGPVRMATGGSTGEPLRYFIDIRTESIGNAALWRGWGYGGYRLSDKTAILSGLSLIPQGRSFFSGVIDRTLNRNLALPAVRMEEKIFREYLKAISQYKPRFLRGYPSSLYFFADFLKNTKTCSIKPNAVFTTAEMLLRHQRRLIEEVFKTEVFDGYGAYDGGTSAFECKEHKGYHLGIEKSIVEFVDKHGDPVVGKSGRIIATDLYNFAMPFIRYDSGDIGTLSKDMCPCGRTLPLMKEILGRTTDLLRLQNGVVLSGPSLTLIFKDFDLKQYQVVQKKPGKLIIRIIKGRRFTDQDLRRLYKILLKNVGENTELCFESVEHIPTTRSGKWKFIVSETES